MADLRAELRPASFRGLAFDIVDDDSSGGRRLVAHEYPGRDGADYEDMGGRDTGYSFRAAITGPGFVAAKKALEAAFDKQGPGTLVLPHYGEIKVRVLDWRASQSIADIGMVTFSVTVARDSGKQGGLTVLNDTALNLTSASDGMFDLAGADFLSSLADGLFPGFVTADGLGRVQSFASTAQTLFSNYGLASSFAGFNVDSLLGYVGLNRGLVDQLVGLFKGTADTARHSAAPVVGSTYTVAPASNDQVKLVKALATLSDTNVDSTAGSNSPSRAAMAQNAAAITTFTQTSALAAAGSAARYAEYESQNQAMEVRDLMADKLVSLRNRQLTNGLLEGARATTAMLVAVTEDINEQIGRLPRTVRVQTKVVRSSLAIANRMYGDDQASIFTRATDLVARNRVAHPGFVGRKPLEVLIDG